MVKKAKLSFKMVYMYVFLKNGNFFVTVSGLDEQLVVPLS